MLMDIDIGSNPEHPDCPRFKQQVGPSPAAQSVPESPSHPNHPEAGAWHRLIRAMWWPNAVMFLMMMVILITNQTHNTIPRENSLKLDHIEKRMDEMEIRGKEKTEILHRLQDRILAEEHRNDSIEKRIKGIEK